MWQVLLLFKIIVILHYFLYKFFFDFIALKGEVMTDARKNWLEQTKKEEDFLRKYIIRKMINSYYHTHFKFLERKNGKPHFHITSNRKLVGEEISDYAKFVYWSLL